MEVFEVGKSYEANDPGYDPILVLKRTDKTIWVKNSSASWCMRVKRDERGDEYVQDSSEPKSWRFLFTYSARWRAD